MVREHRNEAVHARRTGGRCASTSARYAFEPAVHVVQMDAGDDPGRAVVDARERAGARTGRGGALPARHEVVALVELREQVRDLGRIVLQVGVDRDDDLARARRRNRRSAPPPCRSCGGGGRRGRSSGVAWSWTSSRVGVVGRAVVDVDDLPAGCPEARSRPVRTEPRPSLPRCRAGRRRKRSDRAPAAGDSSSKNARRRQLLTAAEEVGCPGHEPSIGQHCRASSGDSPSATHPIGQQTENREACLTRVKSTGLRENA